MSKRKELSNNDEIFFKEIPEFKNEYDTIRKEKGHKQFGFVCILLYDKRMNNFILELRGTSNSQYREKASPIGGKRERYFVISRKVMNELNEVKSFKKILLEIDRDDISNALNSHDGFDNDVSIKLTNWKTPKNDNKESDEIFVTENEYEMNYIQEDIFSTMYREVKEETGFDVKKHPCEIKYFGIDKKIFESDSIVTHVYLIIFDSYDFIPYSNEKKKGNSLIGMTPSEIMKRINEDKDKPKDEMFFTPTISNVFEEVRKHCKPLQQEIILFGGLNAGLSEGVKRLVKLFSNVGLEVSSTLTLPQSYRERKLLNQEHPSIRDLYPGYFDANEKNKVIQQTRALIAYDLIGKLLRGETEPDVGNVPIVIFERSQRCVNIFNEVFGVPRFPLNGILKSQDLNRLDIFVSIQDKKYAYEEAVKHKPFLDTDQKAYQELYNIYERVAHLEYPKRVVVENDYGKEYDDFFTDGLLNAVLNHVTFCKLFHHAKSYHLNLARETPELLDVSDSAFV
jgi:hypothetical protein